MLRTRLWMGTLLVGLAGCLMAEGDWFGGRVPILLAVTGLAVAAACRELWLLFPADARPRLGLVLPLCVALALSPALPYPVDRSGVLILAAAALALFGVEMARYRGAGRAGERVARGLMAVCYVGLLPSSFVRLRLLDPDLTLTAWMLAAAVFVPKCNDIAAYFTGKFLAGRFGLGRHPMAPLLSPKKTWEGFAGGMAGSALVAVMLESARPGLMPWGYAGAVGFGLTVGLAGVAGDLAESMLKRDADRKDASRTIPGFGGVLDVIDSLIFAVPVALLWFAGRDV